MNSILEEIAVTDSLEILMAILATKPAGTVIRNPARQLAIASKNLINSPVKEAIKPHPSYGYSTTFTNNESQLMLAGYLMFSSDNKYSVSTQGHSQGQLIRRDMTPKQLEDCEYIGERLQWE